MQMCFMHLSFIHLIRSPNTSEPFHISSFIILLLHSLLSLCFTLFGVNIHKYCFGFAKGWLYAVAACIIIKALSPCIAYGLCSSQPKRYHTNTCRDWSTHSPISNGPMQTEVFHEVHRMPQFYSFVEDQKITVDDKWFIHPSKIS